ncbi:MAG: N-acetylmuramoyl-L-alanine amidase [Spirochaetia bacterium]|nr:N-acetylmuramoyl-L-alanine amidase [Spirochaetia bacterium]
MNINKLKYTHSITTRTKKTGIVIHGTGGGTVQGAVSTFKGNGVSVPYIIDRDGQVYQLYDEAFDHFHAGANFRELSRCTIGIELVNWNHLIMKDNWFYNWVGKQIPDKEVFVSPRAWRGYSGFHRITEEQHKSLNDLLKILCEKHKITKALVRDFHPEVIKDKKWSGICFHSSFHPTKTDFYPLLIDKIKI